MRSRYPKTEWGIKVEIFKQRYGMTLDELAAGAGVFVGVLRQVMVGRTPGYKITPKVDEFIAHYEATHKPEPFFKPFEELNVK